MENILELVAVHGSQVEMVLQDVEDRYETNEEEEKNAVPLWIRCVLLLRYLNFFSFQDF